MTRVSAGFAWARVALVSCFDAVALGSGCLGDGPLGFVPGGLFAGELVQGPEPDWSFASDIDSVDVQIGGTRPRTVRTGIVVLDGVPYLPVTWAPLKRWPAVVRTDPRVVLRANGRLYERHASPVENPAERDRLRAAGQAKYGAPFHARSLARVTHYFRLDPPASGG